MADKVIQLIFKSLDQATAGIRGIVTSMQRLESASKSASVTGGSIGVGITTGLLAAETVINTVSSAVAGLTSKLTEASTIELSNISAASGLEGILGTYEKATDLVNSLNQNLAVSAASLPGTTAQFSNLARAITDDVAGAFDDANGVIADPTKFQKTLESIATSYTVAGVGSGVADKNTQLFLTNALSGQSSTKQLMRLDAVRKDARLRIALEEALAEKGVSDIRKLSIEDRVAVLQKAGEQIVTPEFIARAKNTYEGITQGFFSKVFDPTTGIFGIMRDLDPQIKGNQTVFEEFKATLGLLIGDTGLFAKIGSLAEQLGLSSDPMENLRNFLRDFNGFIQKTNAGIDRVRTLLRSGFDVGQVFSNFDIGKILRSSLPNIGRDLALFINGVFRNLVGFLSSVDYGALADQINLGLRYILDQVIGFMINLDPSIYAVALGALLFNALIAGVSATVITAVMSSVTIGVLAIFAEGILAAVGLSIAAIPGSLVLLIIGGIAIIGLTIYQNFDAIASMVKITLGNLISIILVPFELFIGIITGNVPLIQSSIQRLFGGIYRAIEQFTDTVSLLTGGQTGGQQRAAQSESLANQKFYATQGQVVAGFKPKFNGNFPNAADGLFSALATESARKPRNSNLVIANDSETILNASQAANVASAINSPGNSGFNPTLIFQGVTGNAEEIADQAIAKLGQMYQQYKLQTL